MIIASLTGRVRPGKMKDAPAIIQRLRGLGKDREGAVQVAGRIGHQIGEVMAFSSFENGSDFEEAQARMWASEEWRSIMDDGSEVFEDGELAVWKILDE